MPRAPPNLHRCNHLGFEALIFALHLQTPHQPPSASRRCSRRHWRRCCAQWALRQASHSKQRTRWQPPQRRPSKPASLAPAQLVQPRLAQPPTASASSAAIWACSCSGSSALRCLPAGVASWACSRSPAALRQLKQDCHWLVPAPLGLDPPAVLPRPLPPLSSPARPSVRVPGRTALWWHTTNQGWQGVSRRPPAA